jgi:hypothetical protein
VHWITTATAVAAVIAASAFVQPADAGTPAGQTATALPGPDARAAHYPLDCAGGPVAVVQHLSGDLDQDGRLETVAVVRCQSWAGTPPTGVYVLADGTSPGSAPQIVATLVNPKDQRSIKGLRIIGRTVEATVLGYSSQNVPRCCPDQERSYSWVWRGGSYYALPGPLANGV